MKKIFISLIVLIIVGCSAHGELKQSPCACNESMPIGTQAS